MERGRFTLDFRSGTKRGFFRVFVSDTSSQGREVAFYLRPSKASALLVLNKRVGVRLVLLGFPYLPTFLYFKVR